MDDFLKEMKEFREFQTKQLETIRQEIKDVREFTEMGMQELKTTREATEKLSRDVDELRAYAESINREQENYRETYKTLLQEMEYLRASTASREWNELVPSKPTLCKRIKSCFSSSRSKRLTKREFLYRKIPKEPKDDSDEFQLADPSCDVTDVYYQEQDKRNRHHCVGNGEIQPGSSGTVQGSCNFDTQSKRNHFEVGVTTDCKTRKGCQKRLHSDGELQCNYDVSSGMIQARCNTDNQIGRYDYDAEATTEYKTKKGSQKSLHSDGEIQRLYGSRKVRRATRSLPGSLEAGKHPNAFELCQNLDEIKPQILILQELSSQERAEGSEVEFELKCEAQDGNDELIYRWYKDGVLLHLRSLNNNAILRLRAVALRDFGSYKCRVNYRGNPSDYVETSPAELNVTPRDGTRYKCLTEVKRQDFNTYERVGRLLSQKKHGLGGWKEVAVKYEMDHLDIDVLKDDPDAGSKTLSFLESANPELKVYDFCKTLKEYNIR